MHARSIGLHGLRLLALLLLAVGVFLVNARLYNVDDLETLRPVSCAVLDLCRFENVLSMTFGLALVCILLGLILTALTFGRARFVQMRDFAAPRGWAWAARWRMPRGGWRIACYLFAIGAAAAAVFEVSTALQNSRHIANVWAWLAAIVLAGVSCFAFDRAHGRTPALHRRELLLILGLLVWIFILGHAFRLLPTTDVIGRAAVIGVSAAIAWGLTRVRGMRPAEGVLFVLTTVMVAVYSYDLNSWFYSYIGDELGHYGAVYYLLRGSFFGQPLDWAGVHNNAPVMSIYLQAGAMLTFGDDAWGWKFWQIVIMALSGPALFAFVRSFAPSRIALITVALFYASHHLLGFSKAGYSQMECIPPFLASMALLLVGLRRRSLLAIFLSGALALAGFYTFGLTLPIAPFIPLIAILAYRVSRRQRLPGLIRALLPIGVVFLIGLGVAALPRLIEYGWVERMSVHSIANSEFRTDNPWRDQVGPNFFYTLIAPLVFPLSSHYTYGAHLDPLSAWLMLIGIGWILGSGRRVGIWVATTYVAACFLLGGVGQYAFPSNTRTFLLVPLYALMGAMGAAVVIGWLAPPRAVTVNTRRLVWRTALAAALIIAVAGWNAYHFGVIMWGRYPSEAQPEVLRAYQEAPPDATIYLLWEYPNDVNMEFILLAYREDTDRIEYLDREDVRAMPMLLRREARPGDVVLLRTSVPHVTSVKARIERDTGWTFEPWRDGSGAQHFWRYVVLDAPSAG